jgi:hypothetical protein
VDDTFRPNANLSLSAHSFLIDDEKVQKKKKTKMTKRLFSAETSFMIENSFKSAGDFITVKNGNDFGSRDSDDEKQEMGASCSSTWKKLICFDLPVSYTVLERIVQRAIKNCNAEHISQAYTVLFYAIYKHRDFDWLQILLLRQRAARLAVLERGTLRPYESMFGFISRLHHNRHCNTDGDGVDYSQCDCAGQCDDFIWSARMLLLARTVLLPAQSPFRAFGREVTMQILVNSLDLHTVPSVLQNAYFLDQIALIASNRKDLRKQIDFELIEKFTKYN